MSDEEEHKCECEPGLPAWMGTFADLMSLLMCFFVLLLSFSEMDAMKFKRLAGSMAQAFGVQNKLKVIDIPKGTSIIAQEFSPGRPEPTPINEIWQKTTELTQSSLEVNAIEEYTSEAGQEGLEAGVEVRIKEKLEELIEETNRDAMDLAQALEQQIIDGEIEIQTEGRKIIIRIREKGSFTSGSATLTPQSREIMEEVRAVLLQKPGLIKVQGHTDDIPISSARFRSNWELSSARAVSVAHELMRDDEINSNRFEVSGFADTRPLAGVSNDTAEGRSKNRRVEIVVTQGLEEELDEEDKQLLNDPQGRDILRDLDLDPEYLFELQPDEIF